MLRSENLSKEPQLDNPISCSAEHPRPCTEHIVQVSNPMDTCQAIWINIRPYDVYLSRNSGFASVILWIAGGLKHWHWLCGIVLSNLDDWVGLSEARLSQSSSFSQIITLLSWSHERELLDQHSHRCSSAPKTSRNWKNLIRLRGKDFLARNPTTSSRCTSDQKEWWEQVYQYTGLSFLRSNGSGECQRVAK